MTTKTRKLAGLIDVAGDVKSASLDNVSAGLTVYATLDDLPTSGLTSGDQAFITATSRIYVSNGSGWYNVALINATPRLTVSPSGTVALAIDGSTPTVITLTATDSDNADASLTYSVDSDGNFGGLGTISQDSSVFTITPLSEDSATTGTSTLTFKASDGISFGTGTTSFTLSFAAEYSSYTTLLAKADTAGTDNQVDASTNTHTITEVGNVTSTAWSPYHPGGYCGYFNATSQRIYTDGNSSDFNLSNSNWTYEGWVYVPSSHTFASYPRIFGLGPYYNDARSFGVMVTDPDVSGYMTVYWNDGTLGRKLISATTFEKDKWNHVAVCREGNAVALFYNGTRIANNASYTGTINGNDTYAFVGTTNLGTEGFVGYWKDVRLVKGSSVYDPTASSIIVPDKPLTAVTNTKLLLTSTPYLADASPSAHSLMDGGYLFKRLGPYDYEGYTKTGHGGSVYFDGAGDYLTVAGNSDFNMGSDFTFECWCYSTSPASGSPGDLLMLVWDGSSNNSVWVSYTSAYKFEFRISYVGSWAITLTSASTFPIDEWHHVVATRNSGTAYLFINGVQEATGSNSTDISSTGNVVNIGSQGSGRHFNGYIADARIINGTAVYTSAFTPPTAPLTAITNTKLLTCTNKNDIWDAGSGTTLTKIGNATSSNTQRKFATSSAVYFDGTGDYLSGNDMGLGGANAFTIEAWMYPTVYNTYANDMYSHGANLSVGADFLAFGIKPDGNVQMFKGSGSPVLLSTSAPCASLNQWYHIAFVRESNNNTSAYVNGVLVAGPTAISGALTYAPTGRAFIGTQSYSAGASDRSFEGYIQDVRITNGVARYTSAFTPPTGEFGA